MEYCSLYAIGKEKLAAAGIPEADLDARLLLEYVCHTSRNDLLVHAIARLQRQSSRRMSSCLQSAQSISRCSS